MSLILRKLAQPVLNAEGLDDFHTQIETHSKCIQIVGECGQPLFNISGITFARAIPGRDEINYAVELLEEFFIKHKVKVKEYFIAKGIYQKTPIPKQTDILRLHYGYQSEIPTSTLVAVYIENDKGTNSEILRYNLEKNTYSYECTDVASKLIGHLAKDKKLLLEMKNKAQEVEFYLNARKVYDDVLQSLQTCEI